ncbi:DUF4382 domain-containing protein [Desulfonema magnum]|uniref:DUF4382 n=1 Tax=Desulfonema magnum TaxID=45655 RepID=A0A975BL63_9BACT|nr:DUF4382 domain-containing protein [Desulfonema magnum]QTA87443.1 DUF4382 [Desulfonema magnum]
MKRIGFLAVFLMIMAIVFSAAPASAISIRVGEAGDRITSPLTDMKSGDIYNLQWQFDSQRRSARLAFGLVGKEGKLLARTDALNYQGDTGKHIKIPEDATGEGFRFVVRSRGIKIYETGEFPIHDPSEMTEKSAVRVTIRSKADGGRWNDPDTWEGGVVPNGELMSVEIVGDVVLDRNMTVGSLVVRKGAALKNIYRRVLKVTGSFVNDGTIQSSFVMVRQEDGSLKSSDELTARLKVSVRTHTKHESATDDQSPTTTDKSQLTTDKSQIWLDIQEVTACGGGGGCQVVGGSQLVNLLDPDNAGLLVADTFLPEGKNIGQLRFVLGTGSKVVANGQEYPLNVPGGDHSGLKLILNKDTRSGELDQVLIDFDPDTSLTFKNGEYTLKPTIKLASAITAPVTASTSVVDAERGGSLNIEDDLALVVPRGLWGNLPYCGAMRVKRLRSPLFLSLGLMGASFPGR